MTLSRPERHNAFDAALIAALADAFADVGDARCVVLAGEGRSFCAGADVEWQRASIDLSFDENVEDAMRLYRMLEAIESCPAPVVARVQGFALGGGSGLIACCDIAVAAPDAVFGYSEVRLGIIPAVISPFVIPRIGPGATRRYFLTGERFDAETASASASCTRSPRTSTRPWLRLSRRCSRAARRPSVRPSSSSGSSRPERQRRRSPPGAGRARRARTAARVLDKRSAGWLAD